MKSFVMGAACLALASGLSAVATAQTGQTARYHWTAELSLESGDHYNCGDPPYPKYKIDVEGQSLRGTSLDGESKFVRNLVLDLGSLHADGSGRITVRNGRGVANYFDFDPGTGPRKFHSRHANRECVYLWTPL